MLAPAMKYLVLRSLGAPAVLLSLAMQGIFRGFKDTRTPLYVIGSSNFYQPSYFNLLEICLSLNFLLYSRLWSFEIVLGYTTNIILDPILIFVCHLGVKGAAIAHVLSQ